MNNLAGALTAFAEMGLADLSSVTEFVRTERILEPRPALKTLYAELAQKQRLAFDAVRAIMPSIGPR